MRKFLLFLCIILFATSISYAKETPPEFVKKNITLFYDVQDQILMCQNKEENIVKGQEQFEKILRKYYKSRFNIINVKRISKPENAEFYDKKALFELPVNQFAIVVKVELWGNGVATDTYQNAFGAKQNINIATTKLNLTEYTGDKDNFIFYERKYGVKDYRPNSFAMFGQLWVKNMDARTLTKNCVNWYIRDVNEFYPPNKYTYPQQYDVYLAFYKGDIVTLHKFYKQKS